MAQLTVNDITGAGMLAPTLAAATATTGDTFANSSDERTFLIVKNGGASPITVSIAPAAGKTNVAVSGAGYLAVPNLGGTVANGAEKWFGPFPEAYSDASGNVTAICSAVTSVTVGAVRLKRTVG